MSKPDNTARPLGRGSTGTPSIIGDNVTIEGNIITSAELQLDGKVTGDITCGSLTMGEHGACKGTITAESTIIRGHVDGSIKARTVRLEQTARVQGDVTHESLAVEAGAVLTGTFTHSDNPLGKPAAPTSNTAATNPAATSIERASDKTKMDAAE